MGLLRKPRTPGVGSVVAIFSLHHASIGKSTQSRPNTAAAHVRYITRRKACTLLIGERMPAKSAAAQRWFRDQEANDRVNARICDKVLLALPRELSAQQRAALVRSFAEKVTNGKASWLAAFHDRGDDKHNPHCHLVIRDRDPETGRRACSMSERGSTDRLRLMWEQHANEALGRAGRRERIDRRTLEDQGLKRRPTIHEGLSSREMIANGRRIRSRPRIVHNGVGARTPSRTVDYRQFDKGRSRPAYNRHLQETEADYWAAIDADAQRRELARLGHRPITGTTSRGNDMPFWKRREADKASKNKRPEPEMFTIRTGPDGDGSYRSVTQKVGDPRDPMTDYDRDGKPKISWSQKLKQQKASAEKGPEPGQEKQTLLDRWRRGREKDKERDR